LLPAPPRKCARAAAAAVEVPAVASARCVVLLSPGDVNCEGAAQVQAARLLAAARDALRVVWGAVAVAPSAERPVGDAQHAAALAGAAAGAAQILFNAKSGAVALLAMLPHAALALAEQGAGAGFGAGAGALALVAALGAAGVEVVVSAL